jgi:hypothetical protein
LAPFFWLVIPCSFFCFFVFFYIKDMYIIHTLLF